MKLIPLLALLLASCGSVQLSKDSTCPTCGQAATRSASIYQDDNGHTYASYWIGNVNPDQPSPKLQTRKLP